MRKTVQILCATLMLSVSFASAAEVTTLDSKVWHHDMKKAHQLAINQDKPMIIVFGASWCKFCKKLEKETLSTPQMDQFIRKNFVPVHLDLDEEKKIGKILEVKSLPCTVILSPQADLLGKIVGYKNVQGMHEQLLKALKTQDVIRQASQKNNNLK